MDYVSSTPDLLHTTAGNISVTTDGTPSSGGHTMTLSRYIELIFGLFTIFGSGLILGAIQHLKVLHTSTNWYIASLAVANSVLAAMTIFRVALEQGFTITLRTCFLLKYAFFSSRLVQITAMLLLSWFSLLAIRDPDATHSSFLHNHASLVIIVKWSTCFVLPFMWAIIRMTQPDRLVENCEINPTRIVYLLSAAIVLLESLMMVYLTVKMLYLLERRMTEIKDFQFDVLASTVTNEYKKSRRAYFKRHKRLALTVIIVLLLYLLTWPLYLLLTIIHKSCSGGCVSRLVIEHCFSISTILNSVTNVIVYSYKLKHFRSPVCAFSCCISTTVGTEHAGNNTLSLEKTHKDENLGNNEVSLNETHKNAHPGITEGSLGETHKNEHRGNTEVSYGETHKNEHPGITEVSLDETYKNEHPGITEVSLGETHMNEHPGITEVSLGETHKNEHSGITEVSLDETHKNEHPGITKVSLDKTYKNGHQFACISDINLGETYKNDNTVKCLIVSTLRSTIDVQETESQQHGTSLSMIDIL